MFLPLIRLTRDRLDTNLHCMVSWKITSSTEKGTHLASSKSGNRAVEMFNVEYKLHKQQWVIGRCKQTAEC